MLPFEWVSGVFREERGNRRGRVKRNNLHGKLILISSSLRVYNLGQNTKQLMYVLEAWTHGGGIPKFSYVCSRTGAIHFGLLITSCDWHICCNDKIQDNKLWCQKWVPKKCALATFDLKSSSRERKDKAVASVIIQHKKFHCYCWPQAG